MLDVLQSNKHEEPIWYLQVSMKQHPVCWELHMADLQKLAQIDVNDPVG